MWKTYTIIALVILAFIGIILLSRKSNTEMYENKKPKSVESRPHGINTAHFPKLPREIDSQYHHPMLKTKLAKLNKCGKCQELEQKLVQDGKQALAQLEKERYVKPNLETKYKSYTDCQMCQMLLQTWNRYFSILEAMSNYIYDKKLLEEPGIIKTNCKSCNEIQRSEKEYVNNLKKELDCRVQAVADRQAGKQPRTCQHVKIPGSYNPDKNCKECEEIFNKWQQYIFSIVALVNYYRFGKQNLKPIA